MSIDHWAYEVLRLNERCDDLQRQIDELKRGQHTVGVSMMDERTDADGNPLMAGAFYMENNGVLHCITRPMPPE